MKGNEYIQLLMLVVVPPFFTFFIAALFYDKESIDDHMPGIETNQIIYITESTHSFGGIDRTIRSFYHPDYPGLICTTIAMLREMGCFYPRSD